LRIAEKMKSAVNRKKGLSLPGKILLGMVLGFFFGLFFRVPALAIEPLGTLFIRLISLVVVPLVFLSLFNGTASLGDIRKVGRIGTKTIAYYLVTTIIAIVIGLVLVNILRPGAGVELAGEAEVLAGLHEKTSPVSFIDNLVAIVPQNPVRSLAEGNMLQIIFLAILFGIALTLLPAERSRPLLEFSEAANELTIKVVHIVMKAAPYGVFALIAAAVGKFGIDVILSLFQYGLVVLLGLFLHSALVFSLAIRLIGGFSPLEFWKAIKPAILVAFSTSSSNATLPVTMDCVEKGLGIPRSISAFVLPLGATINMNGTSLYQGVSAVFIAQAFGIELSLVQMLTIVSTATLAAIGTAGVPGVAIITLSMILQAVGLPLEGIALIFGIERILDMARTVVNIVGDAAAAVVVNNLEKNHQIDAS